MIKRVAFIKAREGMSRAAFRHHYENVHAPLGMRLFPMFLEYRRNYLDDVTRRPDGAEGSFGYDAVNEIVFASREDYDAYLALIARPDIRGQIEADEALFIEPGSVWGFLVSVESST